MAGTDPATCFNKGAIRRSKVMKKQLAALLALACLAGLSVSASAEQSDLVVSVPHEFVAGGRVLPAGKYTVSRISDDPRELLLSSYDNHMGAVVLPTTLSSTPADHLGLTFTTTDDNYLLTAIAAPGGVYTITSHAPSQNSRRLERSMGAATGGK
jgi:hypothetical protein